uniref:PPM-type phosphatase domain-containing protein n=1 Tax=Glycine max TaxID=3847 RepID=A0A0R0L7A2_SOYBN
MIPKTPSRHLLLALGFLLCATIPFVHGESSTCLTVYKNGGAPAVFQSPKCPRWKLSDYDSPPQTTARCQTAMLQGRRNSQEDRALCVLDVRIPFPGPNGIKEVAVGIVAVFDGHNGAEASEMASKLLVEYFVLHTYFLLDAAFSVISKTSTETLLHKRDRDHVNLLHRWKEILGLEWHELHFERFQNTFSPNFDDSFHLEILKEALLRAVHDIDAKFSEEASRNNLHSGSTATVVLVADDKILVANIGDSKAILCSENFQSPREAKDLLLKLYRQKEHDGSVSVWDREKYRLVSSHGLTHFAVKELTSDHHPDRDDERIRVETAGGQVQNWGGVPRINGQLAITRAIGDVLFKSYGVISAPEVTDWQPLTANDSFLVVASDGVFEKMSVQDVCDLLWEVHRFSNMRSECTPASSYSLADLIVNTAFKKGSMDNVAAVVIPLESAKSSANSLRGSYSGKRDADFPLFGQQETASKSSVNDIGSDLIHLEHPHLVDTKFKRILVEVKDGDFGCFYLSENLDEPEDSKQIAKKTDWEDYLYELPQPLPDALHQHATPGGPVNLYNSQNFCFHLGPTISEAEDQCINPEGFASFIGLLESIPLHDTGSSNGSADYSMPDLRYVLKKSFGRGSYGEVWLAFHWNCNQDSNSAKMSKDDKNTTSSSTASDCQDGSTNYTLYILKRIMVERGSAVYLSGLREKYFGEIFLNASTCFEDPLSAGKSNCVLETSQFGPEKSFPNKFRLQRTTYEEGLNHIARYVESFESQANEIWLVFSYEGLSLSKLLYAVEDAYGTAEKERLEQAKHVQILRPSKWWHWLKTAEEGQAEMRNLIWQLLLALKSCHDRNITHRDIKPENMVICFEDQETGRCLKEIPTKVNNFSTKMRIIDFGSGIDEFTLKHLYGSTGPSRAEQTYEYTPPEALLNATWYQGPTSSTLKYDMWSVGVVMLELVLGTPNVFQINALTRALLDRQLEGWNEGVKELAYKFDFGQL